MKKHHFRFFIGLLLILLAFGITAIGCSGDNGDTDEPKNITVTGLSQYNGRKANIYLFTEMSYEGIVAEGYGEISEGSVAFGLKILGTENPWIASGSYYITFNIYNAAGNDEEFGLVYTQGKPFEQFEENLNTLPKLNISSSMTSVTFNQFVQY